MSQRLAILGLAAALLSSAGCSKDEAQPAPVAPTVTAAPTTVLADGTSTTQVSVLTGTPPFAVASSRGTFVNTGLRSTTIATLNGVQDLRPCNAQVDPTCAGPAVITAVGQDGGVGQTTVQFQGSEVCGNGVDDDDDGRVDCADPQCPAGSTCGANGLECQGGACACTGNGGAPEGAGELSCDDSFDNDCDGKIDCADPSCTDRLCTMASGAAGACGQGQCQCHATSATETVCFDGVDQDCDSRVDCADSDCQPLGNALGGVCDAKGMTCSVNLGSGSTCTVCSGNGGRAEVAETSCGDGFDNDCDGIVDCQDPDCAGLACNTAGKTCTVATRLCACNSPEASGEVTCDDGSDNDCDGKIDCADEDCAAATCGASGLACAGTTCACSGNGGVAEASEALCGDAHDNDCDGAADCADPGCRPAPGDTYGLSCDIGGSAGRKCNASATCVCSGNGGAPEAIESSCADGFDNDCDGAVDCLDTDCRATLLAAGKACDGSGNTCSIGGTCTVCSGNGGPPEAPETTCSDSRDNDCDGRTDCADDQCANQACNALVPAQRCLATGSPPVSTCTDITSLYSVTVTATRTRVPADGAATSDVTATFRKTGAAIPNATCTFGPAARFAAPLAVVTNAAGQAVHRFTSDPAGGTATVTASCTDGVATVLGTLAVDQPLLGQVRLQNQDFAVMGARGSGFQEVSALTFELLDSTGSPYPAGLAVSFVHESQGGSYIGPSSNCTVAVPSICTATGVTDASGKVQVLLTSGRKFSLLAVRASATAGGNSASATAGNIAVVGAKASGARISLDCELDNVPALADHDCTSSFVDTQISCTASLADRHGIVLGFPTVVAFKSEAGAAGVPGITKAYDGTPSGTADLGYASTTVAVYGHALPADVAPFVGEHSALYDAGCGARTHNPRDGLSTVIAMANGEEGFVDLNSNGEYDATEPFIDMGEPYLDVNDNGLYDPDEWFEDTNFNQTYDGPNGRWDANTVIWTQTRVVYTGFPQVGVNGPGDDVFSRWYDDGPPIPPALPPAPTTRPTYSVAVGPPAVSETFGWVFTDDNFNPLTSSAEIAVKSLSDTVTAEVVVGDAMFDALGSTWRLLYCDDPVAPTFCAGGTPENACTTVPCYVVPDVGLCAGGTCNGFGYGTWGQTIITGADVGAGSVQMSATIAGVKTPIVIDGVSAP